jgi:hypothetical protein
MITCSLVMDPRPLPDQDENMIRYLLGQIGERAGTGKGYLVNEETKLAKLA